MNIFRFEADQLVEPENPMGGPRVAVLEDRIRGRWLGRTFFHGEWDLMVDLLTTSRWAGVFVFDEHVRRSVWSEALPLRLPSCRATLDTGGNVFAVATLSPRYSYWLDTVGKFCPGEIWTVDEHRRAKRHRPAQLSNPMAA